MWAITADGFLSVVQFNPMMDGMTAERHGVPLNGTGDWLLVRGRLEEHVEYLAGPINRIVDSDTAADYRYRTIVTRDEFKAFMSDQIDEIDYGSHFKEHSMDRPVNKGNRRWRTALYAIWTELELIQPTPAYMTKIWSRKWFTSPEVGVKSAADSAVAFMSADPTSWPTTPAVGGAWDLDADGFDDDSWTAAPGMWFDGLTPDEYASLTDDELQEIEDYKLTRPWYESEFDAANNAILADIDRVLDEKDFGVFADPEYVEPSEGSLDALEALMSEAPAQSAPVSDAPRKTRRRNRRNRNRVKEGK